MAKEMRKGEATAAMDRLRSGTPVLSLGVRHARTSDIARLAAGAGYGVIWIDLEHCAMPVDDAAAIAATADDLGLEGWVRVPERDYGVIGRLLDGGATGIIVPKVETAEEAALAAAACRFPPAGQRSQIARLPHFNFAEITGVTEQANRRTVLQVLIESPAGVSNADAIAAVEGVDILALGMNDLTAELGCPGDVRNSEAQAACTVIATAARRHGKLAVVGGVGDPTCFAELLDAGFAPLIFAGIDTDLIAAALTQRAAEWAARLSA
ncbi:aldolase [Sphingomonas koreensis]|nr:aldolase [Sphingomonas koreensis]